MHRVCFGSRCIAKGFFCDAFPPVCYGEALSAGPAVKYTIQTKKTKARIQRMPLNMGCFIDNVQKMNIVYIL